MLEKWREKLRQSGPAGIGGVIAVVLIAVAAVVWLSRGTFGPSAAARLNSQRMYICSETGKTFLYTASPVGKYPVRSPHSGKDTGFPAQHCYWTADGKLKAEPTYVLMNVYKKQKGPTFCPDCSRVVPSDNPVVAEGTPPPPTKEEYLKRRSARQGQQEEEDE